MTCSQDTEGVGRRKREGRVGGGPGWPFLASSQLAFTERMCADPVLASGPGHHALPGAAV